MCKLVKSYIKKKGKIVPTSNHFVILSLWGSIQVTIPDSIFSDDFGALSGQLEVSEQLAHHVFTRVPNQVANLRRNSKTRWGHG